MKTTAVGIRELRQNLSAYLARVRRGESFVVTERNRPVAELGPLRSQTSVVARLTAEGRVRPPMRARRLDFSPVPLAGRARAGSDALEHVRGERG
jgi:prevent-host-death family protein